MIKPGYKTSEYWGSLIISLILALGPVLVAHGILTEIQNQLLVDLAKVVIPIVIPAGFAAAAYIMTQYTRGRNQLKQVDNLARLRVGQANTDLP